MSHLNSCKIKQLHVINFQGFSLEGNDTFARQCFFLYRQITVGSKTCFGAFSFSATVTS